MKSHHPKVFLVIALLGLMVLASCSREEPALVAPPVVTPGAVVVNEIFSRGAAGNLDWVELYNIGGTSLDISGYKIYDIGGQSGVKAKKEFPSGTVVPAHGFYVITTDTVSATGVVDDFGLGSGGETVWLENASGAVIDAVAFPAMPVATTSYGRYPDGDTTWAIRNIITKGTANQP